MQNSVLCRAVREKYHVLLQPFRKFAFAGVLGFGLASEVNRVQGAERASAPAVGDYPVRVAGGALGGKNKPGHPAAGAP